MNTETAVFYERRKSILPIDFSDRRRTQRRSNGSSASLERRRLTSQIRQYEREAIHIPVRLHIDCKEILGQTQNISAGGLLILINSPLATGTPITLQFSFGESVCYLSIVGQVVFCCLERNNGSAQHMIGVKFSAIHDFDQKILATAIQTLKQVAATDEKSSFLNILVSHDTLAKELSDLSSASITSSFSKTKNISTKSNKEDSTTFQRRKHPRYYTQLKGTLFMTMPEGRIAEVPCEVTNFSRYGLCFKTGRHFTSEGDLTNIQLSIPNGSATIVGVKTLRKAPFKEETVYAGEISFPMEDTRRRIHTFLRTLGNDKLIDRRERERRKTTTIQELERREQDRRKKFGIFTECASFASRVKSWKAAYTYYQPAESNSPGRILINGRDLISLGSKDYLGLAHNPRVKNAAITALERYGTSTNGSRALNGTHPLHEELEKELAHFTGAESCLIFPGGYFSNIGILSALLKKDDVVFLDEDVHASIIDGCITGGAKTIFFKHNSAEDLEAKIRRFKAHRSLIITEGVYSVEGDLGSIPDLLEVATTHHIPIMVDDAHGIGVMGHNGAGTPEHFGLKGQFDLNMGIFSAALAGVGGFVACKSYIKDYILHFSRGILFTTSLTPATTAGLIEALKVIKDDPSLRARLWSNIKRLRISLKDLGYQLGPTESSIMSIHIGNEETTYKAVRMLEARGVYVNAFRRPAVKRGEAKIRISVSAAHSEEDISKVLEAFEETKAELIRESTFPQFSHNQLS